jgi:hypothetical protein
MPECIPTEANKKCNICSARVKLKNNKKVQKVKHFVLS